MYRYIVDNAVTYTPEDLVLFRESPFAAWMERLTLENPEHGIPPDLQGTPPVDTEETPENIIETLRAEGRYVAPIDREQDESERRADTLAAMRDGADFIVNGQLAVDALSGRANLLMRTSGYSELGDFLYIPCETQVRDTFQSSFRLAFAADLLHSLQGQLPPQMLIIRDGADVVPLQTEDSIYYYRAVQKRFMHAMSTFRKHRMPDPAESAHFGRWSECASEVLKQRAQREQIQSEELATEEEEAEEAVEMPPLRVATGSAAIQDSYDSDVASQSGFAETKSEGAVPGSVATGSIASGKTLAEQARTFDPGRFRAAAAPGHTPNLARFPDARTATPEQEGEEIQHNRRSTDATLQNLEFIGSNGTQGIPAQGMPTTVGEETSSAPTPSLGEPLVSPDQTQNQQVTQQVAKQVIEPGELSEQEPGTPLFLPPDYDYDHDPGPAVEPSFGQPESSSPEGEKSGLRPHSVVDLDSAPAPSLVPATPIVRSPKTVEAIVSEGVERWDLEDRPTDSEHSEDEPEEDSPPVRPFNNSLDTSQEFDD